MIVDDNSGYLTKEQFFSSRYAVLIGFIFAVVIARSFEDYAEILFEPWSHPLAFIALISLYIFVILSWAGYQQSLKSYPYTDGKISVLRMSTDFLIVVIYVFMLYSIEQIQTSGIVLNYIMGFVLVFTAYIINGKLRQIEYEKEASKQLPLFYTLSFMVLVVASYIYLIYFVGDLHPAIHWIAVVAPLIATIIWRYRRDIGGRINV